MYRHFKIPPGRLSMDDLAGRVGITRRQVEHWNSKGWLEYERAPDPHRGSRGRIHYDPDEVRVAYVIKVLIQPGVGKRFTQDEESFLLLVKRARVWDDEEYFMIDDRIYLDLDGL